MQFGNAHGQFSYMALSHDCLKTNLRVLLGCVLFALQESEFFFKTKNIKVDAVSWRASRFKIKYSQIP